MSPKGPLPNDIVLKIGGTEQAALKDDLLEVIVDTAIFLPGMFSLRIQDDDYRNSSQTTLFALGKEVEIGFKTKVDNADQSLTLIKGVITTVEPEYENGGNVVLRVRGYDKSFKLTQGKKTAAFQKMMASDIVSQVVRGSGLTVETDSTSGQYEHLLQFNQTDWDFLVCLAHRNGKVLYYRDEKLSFKAPAELTPAPADLVWRDNLLRFEPNITVMGQFSTVKAHGWDAKEKVVFTGNGATGPSAPFRKIGYTQTGASTANTVNSNAPEEHILGIPTTIVDFDTAMASGRAKETESKYVRAEGLCFGDPRLKAGCSINVTGVQTQFAGNYYITQARHEWSQGGYLVWFNANGMTPDTMQSLLHSEDPMIGPRIDGVVPALVTNIDDPDSLGRVKVKYPWLPQNNGADIESGWVRIASIGAGNQRGILFMPEVNDEVLIAFEYGDINMPYLVGGLWNNKDKQAKGEGDKVYASGKVNERVLRSRSGHEILLDDKDGQERILIKDKSTKNTIEIKTQDKSITIKCEGDLTFEAGGKLTLKSTGAFSMSTDASGEIKTTGALDVKSTQKATVSAGGGKLEVQAASAKLEAPTVEVNGQGQAASKSSGILQIQGTLVKIN